MIFISLLLGIFICHMNTYTVYTRSWIASAVLYVVYCFFGFLLFGVSLEFYPDMDVLPGLIFLLVIAFVPLPLAQLSSRSQLSLSVDNDIIVFRVIKGNGLVPFADPIIALGDITLMEVRSYPLSGNYLLLVLSNGRKVRLFRKRHLFNKNDHFFDMYLSLRLLWQNHLAGKTTAAQPPAEQPAFTEVGEPLPATEKPPVESIIHTSPYFAPSYTFRGNQLTCTSGVLIWGGTMLFVFVALLFTVVMVNVSLFFAVLGVVWLLAFSTMLNYFELTNDQLTIKTHNLPWRKTTYLLKEISEAKLDAEESGKNSLMLVLKDFSFHTYKAPTLEDEHWISLKNALEARGIKVKDNNKKRKTIKPQ